VRALDRMVIDTHPDPDPDTRHDGDVPTRPFPSARPAGAPVSSVLLGVHGGCDVVVTVRGPLDDATVGRIARLLAVVTADGAQHVIVDLTACPDLPAGARPVLDELRARLAANGGWLLVEGATTGPPEPSLIEVFAAYADTARRNCDDRDQTGPAIPDPRGESVLTG